MAAPRDALSYASDDVVAGRYRIHGILGRGGFGAVYAGTHLGTAQPVAIKMLQADAADPEAAERFYREARLTAKLTHPNTVRVFDVGRDDDGPLYLVMEMLRGPTLEAVLQGLAAQQRPMTDLEAIEVALAILGSLAEAHAAGLVHRDLKPANVMFQRVPGLQDQVKVLDFGCSHTIDSELTREGQLIGTPSYMSPEQCEGAAVDARADLYALGVILFRCMALRLPFEEQNVLTLLYKHATEPAPDVRAVAPQPVDPGLAAVIARTLAKAPTDRFDSAKAMRKALDDVRQDVMARLQAQGAADVAARKAASGELLAQVIDAALPGHAGAEAEPKATVPYRRQAAALDDPATQLNALPELATMPTVLRAPTGLAAPIHPVTTAPAAVSAAAQVSAASAPAPEPDQGRPISLWLGVIGGIVLLVLAALLILGQRSPAALRLSQVERLAAPTAEPSPQPAVVRAPPTLAAPAAAPVAAPAPLAAQPTVQPTPPPQAAPAPSAAPHPQRTRPPTKPASPAPAGDDSARPRVQPRLLDD